MNITGVEVFIGRDARPASVMVRAIVNGVPRAALVPIVGDDTPANIIFSMAKDAGLWDQKGGTPLKTS